MFEGFLKKKFPQELTSLLQDVKIPSQLSTLKIDTKAKFDYVTEFDLELDRKITSFLKTHFPEHAVVSEENVGEVISFDKPTWVIDPLDGTSNFIYGVPFFSTSIGLVSRGKLQFGYVYDFFHKEAFYAERGEGSFLNGKRLILDSSCSSDFIGISSRLLSYSAKTKPELILELKKNGKFRILGSQALALCYVACGRFQSSLNYEAKIWDDLAGALIVSEAQGSYSSLTGFDPYSVVSWKTSENLFSIASTKQTHETLLQLVKAK